MRARVSFAYIIAMKLFNTREIAFGIGLNSSNKEVLLYFEDENRILTRFGSENQNGSETIWTRCL